MSEPVTATAKSTDDPANLNPPPANSGAQTSAQPGSDMTTDQQEKPSAEQEAENAEAGQKAAAEFSDTQAAPGENLQAGTAGTEEKSHRELVIEKVAQLTHEANRSFCSLVGDHSQVPWDEAPEWQKQSSLNGVTFQLDNPDATPRVLHENWMKEKLAAGWVFGAEKNPDAKTHPCLVDYDKLSPDHQTKDVIFRSIVLGAKACGAFD